MTNAQYVPVRTRHLMHLVITCFTFGLWLPVWVIVAIHNHNRTKLKRLPMQAQQPYAPGYWPPYGAVQVGPPPPPAKPAVPPQTS